MNTKHFPKSSFGREEVNKTSSSTLITPTHFGQEQDLVLGREESFKASPLVWSCKTVTNIVHGIELRLSNMAGGFPFMFAGREWKDSERLYLCGEYSDGTEQHTAIQEELLSATSGYAAKRFIKSKHRAQVRADFKTFRLQWMLYVVWQKCLGNADFRRLLLSIPQEVTLVENTTTDTGGSAEIWGCRNKELTAARKALAEEIESRGIHTTKKALEYAINVETNKIDSIGTWEGQNNMGKTLMICARALRTGQAPSIDYTLLEEANIHILGKRLTFAH